MLNGLRNRRLTLGPIGAVVVVLFLVYVAFELSSREKKIEDLNKQALSYQHQIRSLKSNIDYMERKRSEQITQTIQMCRAMREYENLRGGQWNLYVPAEPKEGQEDLVLCAQGNEPLQAIPMLKTVD